MASETFARDDALAAIDAILVAAALQSDRIAAVAANAYAEWLAGVIQAAAEQLQTLSPGPRSVGTPKAVDAFRSWLDDLERFLEGRRPPQVVLEAIAAARSAVAQIGDESAWRALSEAIPGYRPPSEGPRLPPTDALGTLIAQDAAGAFRTIARDDDRLAALLSRQVSALSLSGLGARELTRAMARQLAAVARHRIDAIVRTELLRSLTARHLAHYRNSPSVVQWRWSATLDRRTCGICWTLHGQRFSLDQPMVRHPRCRCVAQPVSVLALTDPQVREQLEQDTGWQRLRTMDPEQRARILGRTRARLIEDSGLLEQREGWRAVLRVRSSPQGWQSPQIITVHALRNDITYWYEVKPRTPLEVVRLQAALPGASASERKAAEYLTEYARLREEGPARTPEELIRRGRLLDQALSAVSNEWDEMATAFRRPAKALIDAQLVYARKGDRTPFSDAFRRADRTRTRFTFTKRRAAAAALRDFMRRIRPLAGPLVPFREVTFDEAFRPEHRAAVLRALGTALSWYPRAWVAAWSEHRVRFTRSARAYIARTPDGNWEIGVPRTTNADAIVDDLAHELGHLVERTTAETMAAEHALMEQRARRLRERERGLRPIAEIFGYDPSFLPYDEEFMPGIFAHPYAAKVYGNSSREVMTCIIQLLAAETDMLAASHVALIGDEDLRAWFLALLAEAGSE
ncbi:minor capsid protein (plasmid) [Thermomicrobium sp. 4228-Ro]|uniref:minor capsid protein n=1 Tax=Thermomicrobium sp. 4228-Ro TaxID=2993937 RepID=UPI0022499260|nr:minor capsid protein [Thermomicrobium sp. 4228-Ro]MCX2728544.1 minor capsid protein [Thermomicrobium sp. 4228-Ro]